MTMANDRTDSMFKQLYTVGNALLKVNGNNTHSGNLSIVDPDNSERFFATASGSQIGALVPRDIVPVYFSRVSWGDGRATTESNIHRKVLSIPGVNACIHCHHLAATTITFDSKEHGLFLHFSDNDEEEESEAVFQPVDIHGANCLGDVKVGTYKQPVGSAEMEERIPQYLARASLTLIKGHGLFAGGHSLEHCLYHVSLLENSALVALNLARIDDHLNLLQHRIMEKGPDVCFPPYPKALYKGLANEGQPVDDTLSSEFTHWLAYLYNTMIGAFGTGSMSQKVSAREMIFCPASSVPEGITFPLVRTTTEIRDDDCFEVMLHKLIYNHTIYSTCIMTSNPLITAEGMAVMAKAYGIDAVLGDAASISYSAEKHPVIVPIDAEAIYLNPRQWER